MSPKGENNIVNEHDKIEQQEPRKRRVMRGRLHSEGEESYDPIASHRREREERIKALRTKDGGKKPIQVGKKRSTKVLTVAIIAVIVLALLGWFLTALGVPHKYLPAMKVGNQSITAVEYNYYFNKLKQGYSNNAMAGELNLDEVSQFSESGETWRTFLEKETKRNLQETYILANLAKEAGHTLPEEAKAATDDYFTNLSKQLGGQLNMENMLEQTFGKGATPATLRPIMDRANLAVDYANTYPDSYDIKDSEVEAKYKEDPSAYDQVDYNQFILTANVQSSDPKVPLSEEETKKRVADTEKLAEEALEEVGTQEDFSELSKKYQEKLKELTPQEKTKKEEVDEKLNDASDEASADGDLTLLENQEKNRIYPESAREWLFDEKRKEGDKTVISENNSFLVIRFKARHQDSRPVPSIRYTIFPASLYAQSTPEDIEQAKRAADSLKERIHSGEDLEKLDSEMESGSYTGERIDTTVKKDEPSEKMLMPTPSNEIKELSKQSNIDFEVSEWAMDPERKVGDVEAIQGMYGSYVVAITAMKEGDTQWQSQIRNELRGQKYNDEMEAWKAEDRFAIKMTPPGSWFIQ